MTEYNIRLNPNCASVVHTGLKFKTGDKGITFKIAVEELDVTGTTARIVFLRANGTSVESNISSTDGVYTYKTLGNEFAVPGKTVADVKFYTDNDRISTASFIFEVGADTMDGLGAGTSGYSDTLEQMMSEIEATREKMEQVVENAEQTQLDMEAALQKFVEEYAGTGALNPRGAWSPDETYNLRDIVHHGNCLWIGLEESIDVEPTEDNSTAWMFALSGGGESSEEIQKIIDGIIPVGDSLKLGGKSASAYNLGEIRISEKALDTLGPDYSIPNVWTYIAMITPTEKFNEEGWLMGGGRFTIIGAYYDGYKNGVQTIIGSLGIKQRFINSGTWGKWKLIGSDLANYMPLSAKPTGTYTGNGSATRRTIDIGGIGTVMYIGNQLNFAIVTSNGYIGRLDGSVVTGTDVYTSATGMVMETTSALFNTSGTIYSYQKL